MTFQLSSDAAGTQDVVSKTTGASGTVCFDGLPWVTGGTTYYVKETSAPTGYGIDDPNAEAVTVTKNSTCGDGNEATKAFTDTPLSKIQVLFTSLAGTDVTKASIVCSDADGTVGPVSENGSLDPAYDDTNETYTNLVPGTYTCTVVVDP